MENKFKKCPNCDTKFYTGDLDFPDRTNFRFNPDCKITYFCEKCQKDYKDNELIEATNDIKFFKDGIPITELDIINAISLQFKDLGYKKLFL